jgi:hypothetical protein
MHINLTQLSVWMDLTDGEGDDHFARLERIEERLDALEKPPNVWVQSAVKCGKTAPDGVTLHVTQEEVEALREVQAGAKYEPRTRQERFTHVDLMLRVLDLAGKPEKKAIF